MCGSTRSRCEVSGVRGENGNWKIETGNSKHEIGNSKFGQPTIPTRGEFHGSPLSRARLGCCPISSFQFPVSNFEFRVSNFQFPGSSFVLRQVTHALENIQTGSHHA